MKVLPALYCRSLGGSSHTARSTANVTFQDIFGLNCTYLVVFVK